jgi:hypothetical protein
MVDLCCGGMDGYYYRNHCSSLGVLRHGSQEIENLREGKSEESEDERKRKIKVKGGKFF